MTEAALDPLLGWIAAACLATLFAQAALAKLGDAALFEQHLAAYGVPGALLPLVARVWPLVEALAALLLLTPWRTAGALLSVALLLSYASLMAWHRSRGHALDCGCGGEPLPVSWALVLRNLGLALIALAAAAPSAPRPMGTAEFAVVVGAVLLGTLLYAALHQVLRHRAGLRLRRAAWRT
jgi:hypothetical protein